MSKFDWSSLGRAVAKIGAPLLGTALGGPAGGAIGAVVGNLLGAEDAESPEKVMAAIKADPKAAAKLMQFQMEQQARLQELSLAKAQVESQEAINQITEVNLTMRAEAKSEHWPQWIWILWASILGVATMGRNRQKQVEATIANGGKQQFGLIGQMIQAIKK